MHFAKIRIELMRSIIIFFSPKSTEQKAEHIIIIII